MIGLGTLLNSAAIVIGGIMGTLGGKFISERYRDILIKANALCIMFIGISGALSKMMTVNGTSLSTNGTAMMIVSLVLGSLIGEFFDFDGKISTFGEFLKRKTNSTGDNMFVNGFVTSSVTVCVGAMAVVGEVNDGISGDISVLAAKSLLDFIIIFILSAALGKGCIFSAIQLQFFKAL